MALPTYFASIFIYFRIFYLAVTSPRQEKVLLRMFAEGIEGFKGGLSAENYISMTKTSKATATRDLADLVQKGALVKSGELRYTRYALNITTNSSTLL